MNKKKRKGAALRKPDSFQAPRRFVDAGAAMTPLPPVIRKAGFELTLIQCLGRVAIYRQHLLGANPDHDAYEVILPQVRTTNHKGEPVEPYEGYPSAESWGKKGWTFTSLAKALQKLQELAQKGSCAGTVSRRNRWDGQGSLQGRLIANNASRLVPAPERFALPVGQSRQRPMQRKVRLFSADTPLAPTT
jgi:hypothetical protein